VFHYVLTIIEGAWVDLLQALRMRGIYNVTMVTACWSQRCKNLLCGLEILGLRRLPFQSGFVESAMSRISTSFVADPELIQELERIAKPISIGLDHVLFRQGDSPSGVYLLKKGTAILTSRSDGEEIFNIKVGAGSLLGLPAVVGMKPYSLTAAALEGAELSMVSCDDFVGLIQKEPSLPFRLLQVLASEVRFARESMAHL
jgi:hypothetical protein